jgi:Domain of Unknown Function (DUF326)
MKIAPIILLYTALVLIVSPPLFSENLAFQRGVFCDNLSTTRTISSLPHTEQTMAMQERPDQPDADKQMTVSQEKNREKFQACITACSDCVVECKNCANECLSEQDIKAMARCIRLNQDCAAMCILAMESMASNSEFVKPISNLCADICYVCAIECERHTKMSHCTKCAEACRKCAIECSKMNKM